MAELIRFRAVRKRYRRLKPVWRFWERVVPVEALAGVDLEVRAGEAVVLLGPNGAGKTTLLRLGAGALLPDEGEVVVDAAAVGLVAGGERSFYWRLSAEENLRFFAVLYGLDGKAAARAAAAALARVGLTDRRRDAVRTFSSGMRQRLAFARALLISPQLLLVDEFAGELDYPTTLALCRFVRDELIASGGHGVLAATHQLWLARLLADRVVVLDAGRVIAAGTPREVLGTPRGRYSARIAPARAEAAAAELRAVVEDVCLERGAGVAVVTFAEPAEGRALEAAFKILSAAGASPPARSPEALESAYLELLGGRVDA